MGKRGPKPQPSALRQARGNPAKRTIPKDEPQPEGKLPRCPVRLQGPAREAWQKFAAHLAAANVATVLDALALEMLCESYAIYVDALAKVHAHGAVWLEKGDSKIPKFAYSPHWAVMNREWKNVVALLKEFGMTPSSRTGVRTTTTTGKPRGKFAAFV